MLQDSGTQNSKQNEAEASQEANAWLLKSLPDQASWHTNMPPLVSHIRQQFRHLGENTSRLTRWVIGHGSLAFTASRFASLPLLSRALDYIRRKATIVSPMWQRTLDLPWFLTRPRRSNRFTQTTRDIADRKLNRSLQPDELHPDTLLQTLSDAEEGQPGYEAAETYQLAADETYPLINSDLLSPPLAMRGLINTDSDFPFTANDTTLSLHTERLPDRHYLKESTEPPYFTAKKQPVLTADEAYPEIAKNMFLWRAVIVRAPDTTPERLHPTPASSSPAPPDTEQAIDGLEAERGIEVISPDVYQSYQIRKADHRQTKVAEDRLGEDNWQPRHTSLGQRLSQVLMPITQRMTFQRRSMEVHPQVSGQGISEGHAFSIQNFYHPEASETQGDSSSVTAHQVTPPFVANMPQNGVSAQPNVQAAHSQRTLASLRQPSASPAGSGSPIFGDASKRPGPSIIPRMAKHLSKLVSNTMLPEVLTYDEGSAVLPSGISRQLAPQRGQARRQKPSEVYAPLSDKSEEYRFLYGQEYVPSSLGNKYAHQPALELPVASSIEKNTRSSSPHSEELLISRDTTIPELALAPVGSRPVTASSHVAGAEARGTEGSEQEVEYVNAPDVDAVARDVYGILKRRLMAERERALGVY